MQFAHARFTQLPHDHGQSTPGVPTGYPDPADGINAQPEAASGLLEQDRDPNGSMDMQFAHARFTQLPHDDEQSTLGVPTGYPTPNSMLRFASSPTSSMDHHEHMSSGGMCDVSYGALNPTPSTTKDHQHASTLGTFPRYHYPTPPTPLRVLPTTTENHQRAPTLGTSPQYHHAHPSNTPSTSYHGEYINTYARDNMHYQNHLGTTYMDPFHGHRGVLDRYGHDYGSIQDMPPSSRPFSMPLHGMNMDPTPFEDTYMPFPSQTRDTMGHGRHEAYTQAPAFAIASSVASVAPTRGGISIANHRIPPQAISGEMGYDDPNHPLNHDKLRDRNEPGCKEKAREAQQSKCDPDTRPRNQDIVNPPQDNERTDSKQIPTIVTPSFSPEDGVAILIAEAFTVNRRTQIARKNYT